MGGLLGDAAGAVLEFYKRPPTREQVDRAMTLPGGGMLNVAPGQVTDDGELMLALLTALAADVDNNDNDASFPARAVARRYIEWHRSMPFDIGMTCARAFAFSTDDEDMSEKAARYSMLNESNGAAMRCAPIAVWGACRGMDVATIEAHARADARLSHPSPACQEANALFCSVMAHAFYVDACPSSDSSSRSNSPPPSPRDVASECLAAVRRRFGDRDDKSRVGVGAWIEEADSFPLSASSEGRPRAIYSALVNVGHVKHAVILAVLLLRGFADGRYGGFDQAMRDVLLAGGDTDTNACICGYVAGAVCGYDMLPVDMRERVAGFDCTRVRQPAADVDFSSYLLGNRRPAQYRANNVFPLLRALLSLMRRTKESDVGL